MTDGPTIVTGATGFAGRHLLDRLTGQDEIVAWCRPGGRHADASRDVKWQSVDLLDTAGIARAIADTRPSRIYHLAGAPNVAASWENAAAQLRINALGTHHLLEGVRRARRTCRVLVASSAQIYRDSDHPIGEDAPLGPSNPYGMSKLAQDDLARRMVEDAGLDIVIARPFNHIGPLQEPGFAVSSFSKQIARIESGLAPPEIRVGNLEARRDVTDVRDVTAAYERIMSGAPTGRVYNVCSGRAWRIRDLLDHLLSLSQTGIRVDIDPARFRPNDVPVVLGDYTRIHAELGWSPTTRVEDTLRDTLAWWRSEVLLEREAR